MTTLMAATETPKSRRVMETLLLLSVLGVALFFRFENVLTGLGSGRVVEAWGDGLKTYTNALYHIRHDSTYTWFEGMNYPFGEHIAQATEMPLVSLILKALYENGFPQADAWVIPAVHLSMIGSWWLAGLFLFWIFRGAGLPFWWSLPVSVGLVFLAPQTLRFQAHFGLAHLFPIPFALWVLQRFEARPHLRWSLLMAVGVVISALLHLYFLGLLALLIGAFLGFRILLERDWRLLPTYACHGMLMLGLPILFFYFWMMAPDPVNDRTSIPWGLWHYNSSLTGILSTQELPLYRWMDAHLFPFRKVPFEGRAYVGLVGVLFGVWALGWGLQRVFRGAGRGNGPLPEGAYFRALLWTGVAALLLSFAFPFTLPGIDALLPYTGPFKQFRSVGRFAWVFYFALNILAFTRLYQLAGRLSPLRSRLLLVGALALLLYEAVSFTWQREYPLQRVAMFHEGERFRDVTDLEFSRFQAVLPMPFFVVGTDNYDLGPEGFLTQRCFSLSAETGLPLTAMMLARSSISQGFFQWQLVSEPYRLPHVLTLYPNRKPLLGVYWAGMGEARKKRYEHLVQGAPLLFEQGDMRLYEISLEGYARRVEEAFLRVQEGFQPDSLHFQAPFFSTSPEKKWLFNSLDDRPCPNTYCGSGALQLCKSKDNLLWDVPLKGWAGRRALLSFWLYALEDRATITTFYLDQLDEAGNRVSREALLGRQALTALDNNGWGLVETSLSIHPEARRFQLRARAEEHRLPFYLTLDELLLRDAEVELFRPLDDGLWMNNRHYRRP